MAEVLSRDPLRLFVKTTGISFKLSVYQLVTVLAHGNYTINKEINATPNLNRFPPLFSNLISAIEEFSLDWYAQLS